MDTRARGRHYDLMSDNLFVSLKVKPRKFKNTTLKRKKLKPKY